MIVNVLRQGSYIVWKIPRCALTIGLDVSVYHIVFDKLNEMRVIVVCFNKLVVELCFSCGEELNETHVVYCCMLCKQVSDKLGEKVGGEH